MLEFKKDFHGEDAEWIMVLQKATADFLDRTKNQYVLDNIRREWQPLLKLVLHGNCIILNIFETQRYVTRHSYDCSLCQVITRMTENTLDGLNCKYC